ncbi:DUF3303 family protein [Methanoculleus bourgensis]|jgi:hypothetical protein|uniref:DUF3303 domain-containing protein n=2 Tax=Methanoculleus bourgensis TaxID=83986 RepID=I7KXP6_METBM|nr:DUF3303 family protein [Methanoculleus bourgensis]MBT0731993.1 DUF3303 family protein [Methanoculleus bourgensis]MDD3373452.1 DUF3303 family protein [Methanoculleus bourgensis]NMA89294.1 DUF3303 family protein [Methanoculleus bourgensis]NQS78187.1 DUF3303 family protein [Methanoculleus bourgensis]CCJ35285.1 hypothetical protein BN140_0362 [Methanoculleus bourgensis MS2]
MQFISIFTWEPGKTGEVMEARAAEKIPDGVRLINEWVDLGSNTVFRLIETDDPAALLMISSPWGDLGYKEVHPVMESKEALRLHKG